MIGDGNVNGNVDVDVWCRGSWGRVGWILCSCGRSARSRPTMLRGGFCICCRWCWVCGGRGVGARIRCSTLFEGRLVTYGRKELLIWILFVWEERGSCELGSERVRGRRERALEAGEELQLSTDLFFGHQRRFEDRGMYIQLWG